MGLLELFGAASARAANAKAPPLGRPEAFFSGPELALMKAALEGDAGQAGQLVAQGANPNGHGPATGSKMTPQVTLLAYAIGERSERAMGVLVGVGADPLFEPREGDGDAFIFACIRRDDRMLDALYRLYPLTKIPQDKQVQHAFSALDLNAIDCLHVMLSRGLPKDITRRTGDSLLVEALYRQDYDTAEWLIQDVGVALEVPAPKSGVTPANIVQKDLAESFVPGTPLAERNLRLKQMMEKRGVKFPVETAADYRARRKAKSAP